LALDFLTILLAIIAVAPGVALFLQKKLIHSVVFLAIAAAASTLIFLYLDQVLVALLQLLVFVGGLSTYLIVAIAAEEKQVKLTSRVRFLLATVMIAAVLSALLLSLPAGVAAGNDFSSVAQASFSDYFALLLIAVLLIFASAVGSVLVIKKFARLVV
jgi:NADH:ubiquinone oxidoreductase subunit 6 (subunit J)